VFGGGIRKDRQSQIESNKDRAWSGFIGHRIWNSSFEYSEVANKGRGSINDGETRK